MHLVLRVQTDDALRLETEQEMERLREALDDARASPSAQHHRRPSPTEFKVEGRAAGRRTRRSAQAAADVETNFDRSAGASGTYTFTMKPNVAGRRCATRRSMQARQTIERRVNELGVTEPSIAQQGAAAIRFSSSCPA